MSCGYKKTCDKENLRFDELISAKPLVKVRLSDGSWCKLSYRKNIAVIHLPRKVRTTSLATSYYHISFSLSATGNNEKSLFIENGKI